MDGGRRLLRPVREVFETFQPSLPAYVGASNIVPSNAARHAAYRGRRTCASRGSLSWFARLAMLVTAPGAGAIVAIALLSGVGLYGAMLGGQYAAFSKSEGGIPDLVARMLGFGIKGVTISGTRELSEKQILDAVGIGPANSLLFLDVAKLRDKLLSLPLVKDASVSKLYPNRVMIEIEERQPFALWQKDGAVKIVAADGTPITALNEEARFNNLPLVVGIGANARIAEYRALLDAAGDLRPRIRAGMLIAQRRWTLKMTNGVEVALPETGAGAALAELARLQDDFGVLDKDIVSLDLRFPGRLIARLPDETGRSALSAPKPNSKGGQT
jgi:cell division protein FtsQ